MGTKETNVRNKGADSLIRLLRTPRGSFTATLKTHYLSLFEAKYPVIVAVAGMDGAMFTALGGLVPGLIVAVPTSLGYGVARDGETALHTALASCAQGIVAVNIDNGYGAACAVTRMLRRSPSDDGSASRTQPQREQIVLRRCSGDTRSVTSQAAH